MNFKFICLVILPSILFGCTAYHFYTHSRSQERFNSKNLPENDEELDEKARDFFGRKG